ncbi:hypothetical protein DP73_09700 [Desulfosporosinus sp. HMP52]|nr:hypothetical protein DP73_09700 [Desulfosporosinus sp. HMP52]
MVAGIEEFWAYQGLNNSILEDLTLGLFLLSLKYFFNQLYSLWFNVILKNQLIFSSVGFLYLVLIKFFILFNYLNFIVLLKLF